VKSRVPQGSRVGQLLQSRHLCAVALVAAMALLIVPAGASAASPVLEFVVPGNTFPVNLTTEGGEVTAEGFSGAVMTCAHSSGQGEITGPRRAIAKYEFTECKTASPGSQKCKSEGAGAEEIKTGPVEAELVYISQKNREVAVLLNPRGGTYMKFECGGIPARGEGLFLAPGGPLNTETTSFTTMLSKSGGVQTPDEYEGAGGEKLKAIPLGEKNNNSMLEPTGVESTITVTTAEPVEVRAITAEEIEAKQREEAKKQEEALQKQEATLLELGEAFKKVEEHAKQLEAANAQLAAAARKDQEEAGATKKKLEELKAKSHPPSRPQLLAKALKTCKKRPKKQRPRCVASAHRKYGAGAVKGSQR
jgi:hypothetical protein